MRAKCVLFEVYAHEQVKELKTVSVNLDFQKAEKSFQWKGKGYRLDLTQTVYWKKNSPVLWYLRDNPEPLKATMEQLTIVITEGKNSTKTKTIIPSSTAYYDFINRHVTKDIISSATKTKEPPPWYLWLALGAMLGAFGMLIAYPYIAKDFAGSSGITTSSGKTMIEGLLSFVRK